MTLSRQLIIVGTLLFLLVFAGTFMISVNNTSNYISAQLESHAQDTATSLGLSLSPPMQENDILTMTSMVDAIFDRGYYREVAVVAIDGKPIIKRALPIRIESVPEWFVNLIHLQTPEGKALVMVGWQQAAKVSVWSNPGIAYAKLWSSTMETFWWFLGSAVVIMGLGLAALRLVLKPLKAVEDQAKAICNREFPVQTKMPLARELRSVVEAMNKMTVKVKDMLEEAVRASERLRSQAYMDPVTGLANRHYFDTHLQHLLRSPDEFVAGALLLIELDDFKRYNEQRGYVAGDELMRTVGAALGKLCVSSQCFIARLGGANFAILMANARVDEAERLAGQACSALKDVYEQGLTETEKVGHAGVALFRGQESVAEFLSEADMALRAAQAKGPNAWHLFDQKDLKRADVHEASYWAERLQKVISDRQILLYFQPVKSCRDGSMLHQEALLRIQEPDGRLLNAGIFIPMAQKLGLSVELDKLVISHLKEIVDAGGGEGDRLAVNLSPGTVSDPDFIDWLCIELGHSPGLASRLIIELSERGAVDQLDAVRRLTEKVGALSVKVSLDHFGRGFVPFGYLSNLRIDYLKIDGSYIHGIDQNRENQFFVQTLAKIAHGLDIQIIAESVETQAEWETLQGLGVDAGQGYWLGESLREEER
jgi:diguanylate cyclase (GGDEF)-like protein